MEDNGKVRRFYSFATKYCRHHRPEEFPLPTTMWRSRCTILGPGRLCRFQDGAPEDYRRFQKVLWVFRGRYGLEMFSWKELARYLWQLGKEFSPRKYGKARPR